MRLRLSLTIIGFCIGIAAVSAFAEKPVDVKKDIAAAPVLFIANVGQWPQSVLFAARQGNSITYLEKTIITTQLFQTDSKGVVIKSHFLGTSENVSVQGEEQASGSFNFLKGNPEEWKAGASAYKRVTYDTIYPDTGLEITVDNGVVDQQFIINAEGNPDIRVWVEGIKKLSVNEKGELVMETDVGEIIQSIPNVLRVSGEAREKISARYVVINNSAYKLSL
jgi:hypothetical protein